MDLTIEGADATPPVSGGYLIVNLDGEELCIVSVPSPVLGAERYSDSVTENFKAMEDSDGNEFSIHVWSTNKGVEWKIGVSAAGTLTEEALKGRIDVEYQANGF